LKGSGSFSASWGEHLDKIQKEIKEFASTIEIKSESGSKKLSNRGTFGRNILEQLPPFDFIRIFLSSVASLQLGLLESMRSLCFTTTSVGPGMPLQQFDRPARRARGTVKFAATAFHGNKRNSS
jgi:hypothetical protein